MPWQAEEMPAQVRAGLDSAKQQPQPNATAGATQQFKPRRRTAHADNHTKKQANSLPSGGGQAVHHGCLRGRWRIPVQQEMPSSPSTKSNMWLPLH